MFVGHIPSEASPSDLRGLFERLGPVREVAILAEHGFVNFADADTAREAIERFNGRRIKGSRLHVDYSEELLRHFQERGERVSYTDDPITDGDERGTDDDRRRPRRGFPPPRRLSDRAGGAFGFGRFRRRSRSRSRSPPHHHSANLSPGEERTVTRRRRTHSRSPPPAKRSRRTSGEQRRTSRGGGGSKEEEAAVASSGSTGRREEPAKKWVPFSKGEVGEVQKIPAPKEEEVKATDDVEQDLRQLLKSRQSQKVESSNRTTAKSSVTTSPKASAGQSKRNVLLMGSPIAPIQIKVNSNVARETRKIELAAEDKEEEVQEEVQVTKVEETVIKEEEQLYQELYVGNLFNEVEPADVQRLLEPYGPVVRVKMFSTHGIASLDCSRETADNAIKTLDKNLWMDNHISVRYEGPVVRKRPGAEVHHKSPQEEARGPKPKADSSPVSHLHVGVKSEVGKEEEVGRLQEPKTKQDRKKKVRPITVFSQTVPKSFLADMTEIFSRFGSVDSITHDPGGLTVSVGLNSSERQALNCISKVNGLRYKGGSLRARFAEGSEEDSPEFRDAHPVDFHNYPRTVVPEGKSLASTTSIAAVSSYAAPSVTSETTKTELPIGVLPPSSSLGAFGATPSTSAMTTILRNVQTAMSNAAAASQHSHQPIVEEESSATSRSHNSEKMKADPYYLSAVEGEIHTVHSKIVLVQFYTGFSFQLAKFVPGHMYAEGKRSMGYSMSNSTYHNWPQAIKSFLRQGSRVRMDVRRMSEQEIQDAQEVSSQYVMYTTPLVWKGSRPAEEDLVLSQRTQRRRVVKGVVTRLFPKWGALGHLEGEVFFKVDQYLHRARALSEKDSLLDHLAVGDVLAVQCERMEYLQMAEMARGVPGFGDQRVDSLKFMARMVWQLGTEVDPFAVTVTDGKEGEDVTFPPFDFISTSSTLNRQLPAERDASHRSWPAVVESVHLPAGGTLLLDESLLAGSDAAARRVYFHRSRLFVNGVKLASYADLSGELVPGDSCVVDVVANSADASLGLPPFVYYGNEVPWVATSVQIGTRSRGNRMARALRGEVVVSEAWVVHGLSRLLWIAMLKQSSCLMSATGWLSFVISNVARISPVAGERQRGGCLRRSRGLLSTSARRRERGRRRPRSPWRRRQRQRAGRGGRAGHGALRRAARRVRGEAVRPLRVLSGQGRLVTDFQLGYAGSETCARVPRALCDYKDLIYTNPCNR